jgi:hypothetical protein
MTTELGDGNITGSDIIDMMDDPGFSSEGENAATEPEQQPVEQEQQQVEEVETEPEPQPIAPEKVVKLKDGEKEVVASRDALVDVKINGKVESLPLQEVINRASGAINVERANAEIGRERKTFKQEQENYYGEVAKINANVQAILNTDDIFEMAEYAGALYGMDPEAVSEKILTLAYDKLVKLQEMTPRERELEKQNRVYLREQKFRQAQEQSLNQKTEQESKRNETLSLLEEEGFTLSDFQNGLDELSSKIKNNEPIGFGLDEVKEINENTVIDYLIVKDVNTRIVTELESQNKEMASDQDFTDKVLRALLKAESLNGKFEPSEVTLFIKEALRLEGKAVKESLTKSVEQSTNSQSTSSKAEKDEESEIVTFEQLFESLR